MAAPNVTRPSATPGVSIRGTVQWAPSGFFLDGVPGEVQRLLADPPRRYGYGGGPGAAMTFIHARGDVDVLPGQWVTRYSDGRVTVTDDPPAGAPK